MRRPGDRLRRTSRRRRATRQLPRPLLRSLRRALRTVEAGDPARGARALTSIADKIGARMPIRAGYLRLAAGRAWASAGEAANAVEMLAKGLAGLIAAGQTERARRLAASSADLLEAQGLQSAAASLHQRLPSLFVETTTPDAEPELERLPAHCAQCGATLMPSTLERESGNTWACAYCGSRVVPE